MGPCISNNFPCLTQFGQKLDLGPFYIQVLNLLSAPSEQRELVRSFWSDKDPGGGGRGHFHIHVYAYWVCAAREPPFSAYDFFFNTNYTNFRSVAL